MTHAAAAVGMGSHDEEQPPADAPAATVGVFADLSAHRDALLKLARPHNVAPSMLLVLLGAWVSRSL